MKRKTNLSLNPELFEKALKIMKARDFMEITEFIETLIREEWERRHGPVFLPGKYPEHRDTISTAADETGPSYKTKRKKAG